MAAHFHWLTVKDVRRETPECISVAFDIPAALKPDFAFNHGQNITIRMVINGEELRRSYSVCTSPFDDELRVAIKQTSGGRFSTWANTQLKIGHRLEVLPPSGNFFTPLHPSNKKHYIAFAAGSGITPVLSIIKTTLITEPNSSFSLIYGNRDRNNIIFKEVLEALKNTYPERFSLLHILSGEKTDTALNSGRIDTEKCEVIFSAVLPLNQCDEFFLCGPEAMVFTIRDFLTAKGILTEKIHFELFTTPGIKSYLNQTGLSDKENELRAGKTSLVTIKADGISFDIDLPYDGEPVLTAAVRAGADLPYACKAGVCATCRARLIEGKVEMDNNYALEPVEIARGFILTCQSHPRTPLVRIDFDSI